MLADWVVLSGQALQPVLVYLQLVLVTQLQLLGLQHHFACLVAALCWAVLFAELLLGLQPGREHLVRAVGAYWGAAGHQRGAVEVGLLKNGSCLAALGEAQAELLACWAEVLQVEVHPQQLATWALQAGLRLLKAQVLAKLMAIPFLVKTPERVTVRLRLSEV